MSFVQQQFQTKGISEPAVKLLMQSWRGTTKKQYSQYKHLCICNTERINFKDLYS